jgi:hypothetical protein
MKYLLNMRSFIGILGIIGMQSVDFLKEAYTIEKMILELAIGITTIIVLIHKYKKDGRDKTIN